MTAAASSVSGLAPSLDDTIQGTAGDDSLQGSGLNDLIQGLDGDDTLLGSAGDDVLRGGPGDDSLSGGSGNDTLWGGAGNNTLIGGSGRDLVLVTDISKVVVDGGSGFDTLSFELAHAGVWVSLDDSAQVIGVEGLTGTEFADTLDGNAAYNILEGGGGNDYIRDDLYISDAGDQMLGGEGDDFLVGSPGPDLMRGQAGNDSLTDYRTGSGNTLQGGGGDDAITVGGGDTAQGGAGADTLLAYSGNDVLDGGAGRDTLLIQSGGNSLSGGAAGDRFDFDDWSGAPNLITDLSAGDVIWIKRIDANTHLGGDQAFKLVDHLDGHAGEVALTFDPGVDQTSVLLDTDGDGAANMTILISGNHTGFTDFNL